MDLRLRHDRTIRCSGLAAVCSLETRTRCLVLARFETTAPLPAVCHTLEHRLRTASSGLHAIHDKKSFLEATGVSFLIWMLVALAYRQVLHAFSPATGLPDFGLPQAILLMGASVAGGVMQLPFIGGGAQLATIAMLSSSFD